jgi:hypothetical protein
MIWNDRRKRQKSRRKTRRRMVRRIRDVNRLYGFYEQLRRIHMEQFSDLRFGQLIYNFQHWLAHEKQIDGFYVGNHEMIKLIQEFADTIVVYKQ